MNYFKCILLTMVAVASLGVTSNAQDKSAHLTLSVTAGPSSYALVNALPGSLASYSVEAPYSNWMGKGTNFGIEGGILIGQHWKIVLGGGFNFAYNPGYNDIPGTADPNATPEENWGEVPNYQSVALQQSFSYIAYLGTDYCFNIPTAPALKPYLGVRFGGAYASNERLSADLYDMGPSVAESVSLKASLVAGADYYLADALFVGFGFDLAGYTYSFAKYRPQEGLIPLGADSHNIGAFAYPIIKLGVKF